MKYSRRFLTVLLLISLIAALVIFADIRRSGREVEMVQVESSGDISVLSGLSVQSSYEMDNMMSWLVRTTFDAQGIQDVDTDYQYRQIRPPYEPQPKDPGVMMSTERSIPFYWGHVMGEEDYSNGFSRMLSELSSLTPKGEKREEAFLLSDYEDYYRFSGKIDLPGYQLYWGDNALNYSVPANENYAAEWRAVLEGMKEFIRIPTLQDEEVMISVELDDQGNVFSYGIGSTDSDAFQFRTFSVVVDDAFYFTFDTHSEEGRIVDTSLIPDGYGIYKLPFEEDEELGYRLQIDQLENVKRLDPNHSVQHLNVTTDGKTLAVHEISDDNYIIELLQVETLELTGSVEIAHWPENIKFRDVYEGPDFLAVRINEGITTIISGNESGDYRFVFDYDVRREQEPWLHPLSAPEELVGMAFDGDTLAVATTMTRDSADYTLAVIDRTGQLFMGEFNSLLDLREANPYTDDGYPNVHTSHDNALHLEWR